MINLNGMSAARLDRQYDAGVNETSLKIKEVENLNHEVNPIELELSGNMRGYVSDLAGNTASNQNKITNVQTINSSLDTMIEIMGRMNALSAKSLNSGADAAERIRIDNEMSKLKDRLRRLQNESGENEEVDNSFEDIDSLKALRSHYGELETSLVKEMESATKVDSVSNDDLGKLFGNIIREAGNALMAQANQSNWGALSLLQG